MPEIVQGLSSDEDDSQHTHLAVHPRLNGVNGVHDLDTLEGSGDSQDEWDDSESLFEDTIEEMGDEHLFDGGEQSCLVLQMFDALNIDL